MGATVEATVEATAGVMVGVTAQDIVVIAHTVEAMGGWEECSLVRRVIKLITHTIHLHMLILDAIVVDITPFIQCTIHNYQLTYTNSDTQVAVTVI